MMILKKKSDTCQKAIVYFMYQVRVKYAEQNFGNLERVISAY